MENNHFIYLHINPINNEIFYVGQGSLNRNLPSRAFSKSSRNQWWKNYVSKYGNPIVLILSNEVTKDIADFTEKLLIELIGRKDLSKGNLLNLTNGGDSNGGRSLESRKNQSLRMSGENHPMYGKKHPQEWVENNRKSHIGIQPSIESVLKGAKARTGLKRSKTTREKMSESSSGENNGMYGRTGETNPFSKLTWEKVKEIRMLYETKTTSIRKLAKMFNVSNSTIESILKNRTWKVPKLLEE